MSGTVISVLGELEGDALGFVLPHEHLLVNAFQIFQPNRDFFNLDSDLATEELAAFKNAGGGTIIELTTPDIGRDPTGLAAIAKATGINIVMGSGRYRSLSYEPELDVMSTQQVAEDILADLIGGVDGIRPGIIGELGAHADFVSPVEERVHRAAARAQLETNLAISTHSVCSPVGLDQLEILTDEGVDPRRVVIGHADTYPVVEYHRAILEKGAFVQYDTLRGAKSHETEKAIRNLKTLIEQGFVGQLLVSHDMLQTFYKVNGGNGFDYIPNVFVELLKAAGVSQEAVDMITVENPRRLLTGVER